VEFGRLCYNALGAGLSPPSLLQSQECAATIVMFNFLGSGVFSPDVKHKYGRDEEKRHDEHGHGSNFDSR